MRIALLEPVDPARAPEPSNDSERLLFSFLSRNLVMLDCQGSLRPDLAESWSTAEAGRVWTFTLPDSAPVQAGPTSTEQIAAALRHRMSAQPLSGIDSVTTPAAREVRFYLDAGDSVPEILADPALGFPYGAARLGTGDDDVIRMPASRNNLVLEFRSITGDPRDAVDRGVDLMVTRSSQLIEYAEGLPRVASFPLPWSRTYLLIQTGAAQKLGAISLGQRQSMAHDAVNADARVADLPSWVGAAQRCPKTAGDSTAVLSNRVAYELGDDVARALAERIVALSPPGTSLRALGLSPSDLLGHLRQPSEMAYVVAVPSRTLAPCRYSTTLLRNAAAEPLIETRAHALVREGVPPLIVDWDGALRLALP